MKKDEIKELKEFIENNKTGEVISVSLLEGYLKKYITDDYIFTFGKYKGHSLKKVLKKNPQYIIWVDKNVKEIVIPKKIKKDAEVFVSEMSWPNEEDLYYYDEFWKD